MFKSYEKGELILSHIKDIKLRGMILAALGVFIISFDALLVRLAQVDASVVAFYRGLFMGLSMIYVWLKVSKSTFSINSFATLKMFSLIVFLSALGNSLFVFSVKYTVAANTVVFLATSSFFAAIFTYLIIKEKLQRYTLYAIVVSFIGVFIVFGNSFSIGENLLGDILGLGLAIVMGLELTLLRKYSNYPHILIIALSGFLVAFVMLIVGDNLFDISLKTLFWLGLMGLLQMPLAMYLIFISTKYISSAEVSIFTTIETTFAPVWLWIFLNEIPPKMTLVGGVLVVCAIFINALPKILKVK